MPRNTIFGGEQKLVNLSSVFHFASGVLAGWMGIPFEWWFLLHVGFEVWENTMLGAKFFDNAFWKKLNQWSLLYLNKGLWEDYMGDTLINSISDQLFASLGWWFFVKSNK